MNPAVAPNPIQVRRAGPADLETIVAFNASLAAETEAGGLDRAVLRMGVGRVLSDERLGFYLLAEYEGSPAGQLFVTYEWTDWLNSEFWWLKGVYVPPGFRRHGVLRALLEQVRKLARDRNVCGLRLYVEGGNHAARKAYLRLGFKASPYGMMGEYFGDVR